MKTFDDNQRWVKFVTVGVLFLQVLSFHVDVVEGRIHEWERTCVVGECVRAKSAFRSCLVQPLDLRLAHPNYTDVRSDSIFKNRQSTLAADNCGEGTNSGEYIPICCPEKKSEEARLIAGLGAEMHEFPHQVRILVKTSSGRREKCGGTIYNKEYILTAASCVVLGNKEEAVQPSAVEVIVGQNLEHKRIPRNIYSVQEIKVHEGYKPAIQSYGRDNDIALLRLKEPLEFDSSSSHIKALGIPDKGFQSDDRNAIIVGWGRTAGEERPIGALLKMKANINTKEECIRKSMQALRNIPSTRGRTYSSSSIEHGEPDKRDLSDDFDDLDSFERAKSSYSSSSSSSSRSSSSSGGSGRRGGSIFDDDDFFNWGRRSGSRSWNKNEPVNLGAMQLGKLWDGGIHGHSKRPQLEHLPAFPDSLLCIGGDGKGYSRGDTGGPAICEGPDGSPILCGISSFGRSEFRGEWPSTFVNVAHYSDWIRSTAGQQVESTLTKEVLDGEPISSSDEANFFIRIRNKKTNTTCGGALINSRTVLSSVSCVPLDVRTDDLVVTSGQYSVDNRGNDHEVDGVATRETYKNYRSTSRGRDGNVDGELKGDFPQLNLAVLKLYRPVRSVKPIQLIKPRMDTKVVHEYGWRNDDQDKSLNKWAYKEVPLDSCRARYAAVGIQVDEAHLCATETYTGGERCNKELGNPLVCEDRSGTKYLCGVTSIRDCSFSFPTVFTNLVQNLDWIQL